MHPTEDRGKSGLSFRIFAYWHDPDWDKFVGATVKIWDLAHNLAALGHRVVLFVPRYHFSQEGLPFRIVELPLLDIPGLRYLSFTVSLLASLLVSAKKHDPDIVYVRRGISVIPILLFKTKRSVIAYEVNDDPYRKAQNPRGRIVPSLRFRMSVRRDELFLRMCDIGLVVTEGIAERICRRNPSLRSSKLVVIPSGSNVSVFRPLLTRQCRLEIGLEASERYVCFAGTLLRYQGIDVLIEAAQLITERVPTCTFLIIGEGPEKDRWSRKVQRRGLQKSVLFLGQINYEALPKYVCASDVCVAPFLKSVGLSSPVKIFDYLACGKPVVASQIDGTTDIFRDCGAVRLIPPEEPKQLASAIIEILENGGIANTKAKMAREFVVKNYDRRLLAKRIAGKAASIMGCRRLDST